MEHLLRSLRNGIERADAVLEDFQKRLAANPIYAFQWADSAMKASARKHWFSYYVGSIEGASEENRTEANIRKFVTKEILQRSASRSVSSSRCSNAVADFELEALTEILDFIVE